ncbi:MAG: DUF2156 domain-containing protein [Bdellovibrionales bacterium]|nr:DUF2156 domain-containing protein [Bdellovibrionales bacterium]
MKHLCENGPIVVNEVGTLRPGCFVRWRTYCVTLGCAFLVFGALSLQATTWTCIAQMQSAGKTRLEQLQMYGNQTLSFATLQDGLRYFDSDRGYIAYEKNLGVTMTLGDPVAPPEERLALLKEFLKQFPTAVFAHINADTARDLESLGFRISELGEDARLDLETYTFVGPKKAKLRQASRSVESKGFRILEMNESEVDMASVQQITEQWRQSQTISSREVRFLNRPIVYGDEIDVRKFYVVSEDGTPVSFVFFDPIYQGGEVIGYSPSIKRRGFDSPTGAEEATVKYAIEQFQQEGRTVLRLGLSPLANLENNVFRTNWTINFAFDLIRKYGDGRIYSFKGHDDFKHRYRGDPEKVYYASKPWWNARQLIALMRACRIFR